MAPAMRRHGPARGGGAHRPSWRLRRRIIFGTLAFAAGVIVWLLVDGADTRLNETIAQGVMILAGSVIGAYVFGAAWDDSNVMRFGGSFASEAGEGGPDIMPEIEEGP